MATNYDNMIYGINGVNGVNGHDDLKDFSHVNGTGPKGENGLDNYVTHKQPKTEDIHDGISEHLENMLCQKCHKLKQLRILPCPNDHSFCEGCLDMAMILKKCPLCSSGFEIPPGGVSGLAIDVTHEQIKDVLDSLCRVRSTNCPVCALDENQAKLANKVYEYCRQEKELVCTRCVGQCERDLELLDYNKIPETTDSNPSAPIAAAVVTTATVPLTMEKEVKENGHEGTPTRENPGDKHPDKEEHPEKVHPGQDNPEKVHEKVQEKEVTEKDHKDHEDHEEDHEEDQPVANGDDESSTASSGEDEPDARLLHSPPVSPSKAWPSPSISASSSNEPINTPPPAYEADSYEAPALPAKGPLPESDDSVSSVDVPILHNTWSHIGTPLSRGNDVIFVPKDDTIIVADWYSGEVHRFTDKGEHTASRMLKHSPWSWARERSKGPWSIAYSYSDDKVYVSEIGLASIGRMCPKDLKVEKKRVKLEGVTNPAGLAFLRNNQLVLTEDTYRGPHRVAIYDLSGKLIKDWESADPQLVCVDNHDRIIISDHKNNRVEIYDTTGRLLTSFGDAETLHHPMGVATDKHSNIYVTHEVPKGYALSLWSAEGRQVGVLQEWDHGVMTLTDRDQWHMRSVDVHNNQLVLLGRRTLHGYTLKGL